MGFGCEEDDEDIRAGVGKMRDIKVFFRLGTSRPMLFTPILNNPPKGVRYILTKSKIEKSRAAGFLKSKIWPIYTKFQPPVVRVEDEGADIIFSTGGIMIKNEKPWLTNIEGIGSFANHNPRQLLSARYRRAVERIIYSENCKKILPYSEAATKSMFKFFPDLKKKTEVMYLPIEPQKFKRKKSEKVRLIFVGIRFFMKGGHLVLKAFEQLRKSHDIELTMISDVPKEYKEKYVAAKYVYPVDHKDIWKFYTDSDIFVFPSHFDGYGAVLMEAMSSGLPVVSVDAFAIPEIIKDGKNGLLVHTDGQTIGDYLDRGISPTEEDMVRCMTSIPNEDKLLADLVEKIKALVESKSMRDRMGRNSLRDVSRGRFSIKTGNKVLKRIYEEALRK
jgi:glycosyltransferase involved in cell wall biosynthesis